MQSDRRISLVPLRSLCNSSHDNSIATDMGLNAAQEMDVFYSRCLLCACTPADLTPHLHIFSEAGNQLQLADKIHKYLNIQIDGELPQNVCRSCMEKLEVTHELVTCSQQARVTLLNIRQQTLDQEALGVEAHGNESATNMAAVQSRVTPALCESNIHSPPTSQLPEEHMDIENVFIKQEIVMEDENNAEVASSENVCDNSDPTEAPSETLAVEHAHCSRDYNVCAMEDETDLHDSAAIKDEIETEDFTFPQLDSEDAADLVSPSTIPVTTPLLANPDTTFISSEKGNNSTIAKLPESSNEASQNLNECATISETPNECLICHLVLTCEASLLQHCSSAHTVNYTSMGSISYQRPFRFTHCKVEKCMWKTKFLGVDRKELVSQFKIHAQINHNNTFVCEYCLGMYENRETFCDHNSKYHPKHKCEFSSSNETCDCRASKKVVTGTVCGISGCSWRTNDRTEVRKHMELKHPELHVCYYCLSIFVTAKQRHAHVIEKHMKSCTICDFRYISNTALMNHCHITHTVPSNIPMISNINIELNEKSTKHSECQVEDCNFVTESEDHDQILQELRFHCNIHHRDIEICDRCFAMFPSSELLDSHIDKVHFSHCKICNCPFKTPYSLLSHCKSQHPVSSNWNSDTACIEHENVPQVCNGSETSIVGNQTVRKCLICDCTLYKSSLFAHNVTYHLVSTDIDMNQVNFTSPMIRKMQCKNCQLVFTRLYDLKVHYFYSHSIKLLCSETGNTRNFSCTVCDEPLRTRKLEYIQYHYQYAHRQELDTDLLDFSKWYIPNLCEQSSCEGLYIFHCKLCSDLCTSVNELILHYKHAHSCSACVKCRALFQTEKQLILHWNEVHFVTCNLCDYKAEFGQTMIKHTMTAHNKVILDNRPRTSRDGNRCRLCPDHVLSNKRNAKMHNFWYHNKYTCEFCWQMFGGPTAENKHVLDNHLTECIHCNVKLNDLKSLENHLESQHQHEKCNICETCGEFLNDRNALKLHRESAHKARDHKRHPNLLCSKCGSMFHSKKLLDRHMANVHPVSEVNCGNFCKLCNKKYKNIMLHRYISHKDIYKKENGPEKFKKLECSFCKQKFYTIANLLRHMKRHSKYKCKQCPMEYTLLPHLEEHVTELHTNRCAYSCSVCSNLFATESDFNFHKSFHSADCQADLIPVLRCDMCDHLCRSRDVMVDHVKAVHLISGQLINVKRKKPVGRKPYIKRVL